MLFGALNEEELGGGSITSEDILEFIDEGDIFELAFGYYPVEHEYVTSPFRVDATPGAYFTYAPNGRLLFIDFADPVRRFYDCFDAIQVRYSIGYFPDAVNFVYQHFTNQGISIKSSGLSIPKKRPAQKQETVIKIQPRNFTSRDARYWKNYGISRQNLIQDGVFAISRATITKAGHTSKIWAYTPTYCYTKFRGGRKKLYAPLAKGKQYRFITNCTPDDVGDIDQLNSFGRQLIITKSYKDSRVLRNLGLNCVWVQNEVTQPSNDILRDLTNRFKSIVVLYDNDITGIASAYKLSRHINNYSNISRPVHLDTCLLPKITDPADLYRYRGEPELIQFLKSKAIL